MDGKICIIGKINILCLNLFLVFALGLGKEFLDEGLFVAGASLDRGFGSLGLAGSRGSPDTKGSVGTNEGHGELVEG